MKRHANLFDQIVSIENLRLADANARKGKKHQYGIRVFDRNPEGNLLMLNETFINKRYQTSEYTTFKIKEIKERLVYRLPYYPDRIAHHAVMNVMEPLFNSWLTSDTFSCVKGRGIHMALRRMKKALRDVPGTTYYLKLDITKFYPSVNHDILKELLRKKIKDKSLLWLLDEIIDSAPGLPIGNYLSQHLANFYLTYFDHWIKEEKGVKYYFRYADDIVILSSDKIMLHSLLNDITEYLQINLKLQVKRNYQVSQVKDGIDFIGYVFFHTHIRLRKRIKQNFARAVARKAARNTIEAYKGWAKHANAKHLIKKLLPCTNLVNSELNQITDPLVETKSA